MPRFPYLFGTLQQEVITCYGGSFGFWGTTLFNFDRPEPSIQQKIDHYSCKRNMKDSNEVSFIRVWDTVVMLWHPILNDTK